MPRKKRNSAATQRTLHGERFLYLGQGDTSRFCAFCNHGRKKGMMSRYKEMSFCNEDCVVAYRSEYENE